MGNCLQCLFVEIESNHFDIIIFYLMIKTQRINLESLREYLIAYPINLPFMVKVNDLKMEFGINDQLLKTEEIILKARKLNSKELLKQQYIPSGKSKSEQWAFGQYKIFIQIFTYYIFHKRFNLEMLQYINITDIDSKHYIIFQNIFISKTLSFVKYEFLTLLLRRAHHKKLWSEEEINLFNSIIKNGQSHDDWRRVSKELFVRSNQTHFRSIPQCRERWKNYQSPKILKTKWKMEQDEFLLSLVQIFGLKWSFIAKEFKGSRNDHQIKNRFKCLERRLKNSLLTASHLDQRIHIIREYIKTSPNLYQEIKVEQYQGEGQYHINEGQGMNQEQSQQKSVGIFLKKFNEGRQNKSQAEIRIEQSAQVELVQYDYVQKGVDNYNMEDRKDQILFQSTSNGDVKVVREKNTSDEDDHQQLLLNQSKFFFSEENPCKCYDIFGELKENNFPFELSSKHKEFAEISKLFGNDYPSQNFQCDEWLQNLEQQHYMSWIQ